MPMPDPHLDQLLRTAIEQTRLLRLRYRNKDRIVEPHDYGQHNGAIKLLTWQNGGSSSGPLPNCAGWRSTRSPMRSCSTRPSQAAAPPAVANITNGTNSSSESNPPIIRRAESPHPALRTPAENSRMFEQALRIIGQLPVPDRDVLITRLDRV